MKNNELQKLDKFPLTEIAPILPGAPIPFAKEIYLYDTRIAGTSYIKNIDEIVRKLKVGDKLTLLREINNKYDEFAIIIKTKDNEKIGYFPQIQNIVFSRLMDAGKLLSAKIDQIDKKNNWYDIKIKIYMLD